MTVEPDPYHSRTGAEAHIGERVHPVVYGRPDDGPLDSAELARFERDGFLELPALFSSGEVDRLVESAVELATDPDWLDSPRAVVEAGGGAVRSVFAFHTASRGPIAEVSDDQRIAGPAAQILGSELYVHQSRVNFKPGYEGKEFWWHSDFETWHVEDGMPAPRALSAVIALTDNRPDNGPLMVVPGSHRRYVRCIGETPERNYERSLVRQEIGVPDEDSLTTLIGEGGLHSFTGAKGSVFLFDSNLMHGSGSNITPFPRSSLFVCFNSVENALVAPFSGQPPRPEHVASRRRISDAA